MKTFEQWMMEIAEPASANGKPQPTAVQKQATVDAKTAAAKTIQQKPEITAKLTAGGATAKQAQTTLSANVAGDMAKTTGNSVDPTKAAFSGVDSIIDDIENSVGDIKMMKKRMKK